MTRIATAFYDAYGTLFTVPEEIAAPDRYALCNDEGFQQVLDTGEEVTVDEGFYHRFARTHRSEHGRFMTASALTDILERLNCSGISTNLYEYWFEMDIDQARQNRRMGLPVPRPGWRFVLDMVYLVEEPWRDTYSTLPARREDLSTLSRYYRRDPIAVADPAWQTRLDVNESKPDRRYLPFDPGPVRPGFVPGFIIPRGEDPGFGESPRVRTPSPFRHPSPQAVADPAVYRPPNTSSGSLGMIRPDFSNGIFGTRGR